MDKFLEQFSLTVEDSFSSTNYIAYILLCAALLYLLAVIYNRYGQSISNRSQLSKVLMIVGLTTFIIISIVKSSLALSLGLVGALSIVRFRTAIKEPEELGYFFMAIAIGLGMGANQLLPTLIGFVVLLLIIILQHKGQSSSITQNLLVNLTCDTDKKTAIIKEISDTVSANTTQVEVKRIQHEETSVAINFLVKVKSLEDLNSINTKLIAIDPKVQVTFIDNTL
ncbi:DUF4956 domain-containing protein [Dokdonia pacifica]|uniref:DUF4956 domain-containing protein n=1 Tax=Dokdonia pacifica TaxID=1627892 RepID=A0A238WP36_9FLAO|nr:DUF4956 domain-containing protein [Dokdonia pacifica]GGG22890.1 DUF4956 domain-containing protein [Dokdonia pacifica]SNR48322.1 protein of unknown function [Dokdonia pacifica]